MEYIKFIFWFFIAMCLVTINNSISNYVDQQKIDSKIKIEIAEKKLDLARQQLEVNKTRLILEHCDSPGRFENGRFYCVEN